MHWNSKYALKHRDGELRRVKKFLLWPRQFNTDPQWHWLETVIVIEEVRKVISYNRYGMACNFTWKWVEIGLHHVGDE